jgi:hypothetical protein
LLIKKRKLEIILRPELQHYYKKYLNKKYGKKRSTFNAINLYVPHFCYAGIR